MPSDTAIIFLTHVWHEVVARRFERLRRETQGLADCYVVLQDDKGELAPTWQAWLASIGAQDARFAFNAETLPAQLGFRYFGLQRIMGNAHFPLLLFARSKPQYSRFWQIEFDVEWRGVWREFFEPYGASDASRIAAHFHKATDWPDWFWWPSLSIPPGLPMNSDQIYKAFMAVARFSRPALESIERAHRQGWLGHFEAVVPTVLLLDGHRLEDLNVRRTAYMGPYQDPIPLLPLQSTVRCRPVVGYKEFSTRGQGPLLFHPVKELWTFDGQQLVS